MNSHLTLTRRVGERIRIETVSGEQIWVELLSINGRQAKINFLAPKDIIILREEIIEKQLHATA